MPQPPNQPSPRPQRLGGTLLWHHAWTAVLAANLVMPIEFASELFHPHEEFGKLGIALAIAVLWLIGEIAGLRSRDRRFILISGGLVVAASQALPFLQIMAGLASLLVVGWALDDPKSDIGCFALTLLTGAFLLIASWLAGFLVHRARGAWQAWRKPREA